MSGPAPCRERTAFPWLGVLLTDVPLSGTQSLTAGTMVRVESRDGGSFTVRTADSRELAGSVPASAVDEPLCATIESRLLGRTTIRWGAAQHRWRGRARANGDIELTEGRQDGDPVVTVRAGDEVAIGRSEHAGTYVIAADRSFLPYREVPVDWVTEIRGFPPYTQPLGLLCFEFPAYAAELAGLQDETFVQTANRLDCFDSAAAPFTLIYWARSIGADPPARTEVARSELPGIQLQRGDLVHLYQGDTPIHTTVATGDGQYVYSLWNMPEYHPVRVTLSELCVLSQPVTPVTHVRSATPEWHLP